MWTKWRQRKGKWYLTGHYWRTLKPHATNTGCLLARLQYEENVTHGLTLGRLMLEVWTGVTHDQDWVAVHLDGDQRNCRLSNLRWRRLTHHAGMTEAEINHDVALYQSGVWSQSEIAGVMGVFALTVHNRFKERGVKKPKKLKLGGWFLTA